MHQRVEKSRSEPAIPPVVDQPKPGQKQYSSHRVNNSEARKHSAQSSTSTGTSERKPSRSSRTTQGASLNEVRFFSHSLFTDCLFSQRIVERANENESRGTFMTANARSGGWVSRSLSRSALALRARTRVVARPIFGGKKDVCGLPPPTSEGIRNRSFNLGRLLASFSNTGIALYADRKIMAMGIISRCR